MSKPVDRDADTDRLIVGVRPLTLDRLGEILGLVSRAQASRQDAVLPPDDVLAMIAEIRARRQYVERARKK